MADSENSRTLPQIIQRKLCDVITSFLAGKLDEFARADNPEIDPALLAWREWVQAFDDFARLSHVFQRLEGTMLKGIGFPKVKISVDGGTEPVVANTPEQIDALLPGDERPDERDALKRTLAARVAEWEAAKETEGLDRARAISDDASDRAWTLAEQLWATTARSALGAMAKIHSIVQMEEPGPDSGVPWMPLRGVLTDFLVMNGVSVDDLPAVEVGRSEGRSP